MGSPIFLIVPGLAFPSVLLLLGLVTSSSACCNTPGVCGIPFYLGCSPIELWDSLSTYVHPGIACLASWSFDWLGALWASLSGVQLSVTFVRLNVIGLC